MLDAGLEVALDLVQAQVVELGPLDRQRGHVAARVVCEVAAADGLAERHRQARPCVVDRLGAEMTRSASSGPRPPGRRGGPLAPGGDRTHRRRPQDLAAHHLHPARQRAARRRGHPESEPRRAGPCRRSLDPDRAGRRHLPGHRAVAWRAAAEPTCARWCSGPTSSSSPPIWRCCRCSGRGLADAPVLEALGVEFAAGGSDCGRRCPTAVSCGGCPATGSSSTWWCPASRPRNGGSGSSTPGCGRRACGPTRRTGSPRCARGSGVDTDERTIPHEVRLDRTGRPSGQGLLPRPGDRRARPQPGQTAPDAGPAASRRLGGSTGRPATRCWPADAPVGRLGTVVDHVDDGPIALALLKRGLPAETALTTGGETQVAAVIDPDSMPAADRARAPGGSRWNGCAGARACEAADGPASAPQRAR